jgi:hypothetical protein
MGDASKMPAVKKREMVQRQVDVAKKNAPAGAMPAIKAMHSKKNSPPGKTLLHKDLSGDEKDGSDDDALPSSSSSSSSDDESSSSSASSVSSSSSSDSSESDTEDVNLDLSPDDFDTLLEQQQTGSGESELKSDDFNALLALESDATSTGTALS